MHVRGILGGILLLSLLGVALLAGAAYKPEPSAASEPARFKSYEELVQYIEENTRVAGQFSALFGRGMAPAGIAGAEPGIMMQDSSGAEGTMKRMESAAGRDAGQAAELTGAPDYSGTNVQVQGVDEADLVKTDGTYLYVISGQELFVMKAYPAGQARRESTIKFDGHPGEAFINGDTLVVFGNGPEPETMFVHKYDVTNRANPRLVQENKCDGYYVNSRMIGNHVYAVINTPVYRSGATGGTGKVTLPRITTNGQVRTIPATEIHWFPYPDHYYRYTTIITLNTGDNAVPVSKTFLTGVSQNLYVSTGNIYLTGNKTPDFNLYTGKLMDGLAAMVPAEIADQLRALRNSNQDYTQQLVRAEEIIDNHINQLSYDQAMVLEEKITALRDKWYRDIAREQQKTAIYKLAINGGRVEYRCRGEVDGRVLNQFSMDEHNGHFRIATTSEGFWFAGPPNPRNNVYVLDENLQVKGSLLGLAPTERIYSARFMGDRAYLVTFRQVDPLFVIDLKDPAEPKVLGELKIPGYSDYLHPYDENHLIGIGREVTVSPEPVPGPIRPMVMPPPTTQRGVKIALFDVSNPTSPKEVAKYVVERDDSDSPALRDHRAMLFNRDKNLLVLPISYRMPFRIMVDQPGQEILPVEQGWEGAFVFEISPEKGIRLRGKIEHPAAKIDSGKGYYESNSVKRSLYIENVLYTVSDRMVKMNDLDSLRQIKQVNLR